MKNYTQVYVKNSFEMLLYVNSDNPGEVNNYKYLTIGAFIIIAAVFVLYFSFRY